MDGVSLRGSSQIYKLTDLSAKAAAESDTELSPGLGCNSRELLEVEQ